ncbi:MAG TPA: hypothetical protein VHW02_06305 [Rhizomicrobium sp.]|jgi:hypothetical protein|nr:hypothetical protein [Rhizomicrobium sp.]
MKIASFLAISGLTALALTGAARAQGTMPMDTPTQINGVDTVCTGVGDGAENDPRWAGYPIRVVFSNGGAQFLSGVHLTLSGKASATLDCAGPWVLLKLPPGGNYKVTATLLAQPGGTPRSMSFTVPSSGQKRVEVQFPGVNANQ